MKVKVLKSKIGKLKITEIKNDSENNITIDADLMVASAMFPFEKVTVCNKSKTVAAIVFPDKKGSCEVCLGGNFSDLFKKEEEINILSFGEIDVDGRYTHNANTHHPRIVKTNQYNRIVKDKEPVIKKLKPIIHKP